MAIYHCSIKIGSRSNGQSAIAAAAYRSGDKLKDNETGQISDYTKKSGIVFSEISLCDNAPAEYSDREILWNSVHSIEKNKNSRLWREFEVALPKELNREEQKDTVRRFVKGLNEQGMCVDWSLHDKGDGNPHAHIMATVRSITEDGKWAPKSRKVYDLDENGQRIFQKIDKSGRKQYKSHKDDYNDWNKTERVEEWRASWADCCNAMLSEENKIDHRSYERQGIDQIPTIHEGYAARKIAAAGGTSERVEINNEIREKNNLLRKLAEQLKQIALKIKEFGNKLKELHEAEEVHNEVIISSAEGINRLAEPKTQVQLPRRTVQRKLSQEEIRKLADLKHIYIYQYCANEYLREYGEPQDSAQKEYEYASALMGRYTRLIDEYHDTEEQYEDTFNPIKSRKLRKLLEEQGGKACSAAMSVSSYFKIPLYYNNSELNYNNIDYEHLCAIKRYAEQPLSQKKEAAEAEIKANKRREELKSLNICDKSVDLAYKKLIAAVSVVPDEQCEIALKAVREPTIYFSFERRGYNSDHRLKAMSNVEKAISRLYEVVQRIKAKTKPKDRQKENPNNYRSYGGRRR